MSGKFSVLETIQSKKNATRNNLRIQAILQTLLKEQCAAVNTAAKQQLASLGDEIPLVSKKQIAPPSASLVDSLAAAAKKNPEMMAKLREAAQAAQAAKAAKAAKAGKKATKN